jgi:argininosuccinate lyase
MPGYTHMQRAIPTSVESWLLSYSEAFTDAKHLIDSTLPIVDQNPLGSAAGFEMTLPIDRQHTTKSLGFAKVQQNPMYCGLSRGFLELFAIQALNPLMVLAGKFAHDMLLFTTEEFGFFSLPRSFTTGSSIMPHKHNYDLFELMRAKANIFGTYSQQVQAVSSGVGSGYNRDLQLTKGITVHAFKTAQESMEVLCLVVPKLELHKQNLIKTISPEMNSVAKINDLVAQGIPFRDAYIQVKNQLDKSES